MRAALAFAFLCLAVPGIHHAEKLPGRITIPAGGSVSTTPLEMRGPLMLELAYNTTEIINVVVRPTTDSLACSGLEHVGGMFLVSRNNFTGTMWGVAPSGWYCVSFISIHWNDQIVDVTAFIFRGGSLANDLIMLSISIGLIFSVIYTCCMVTQSISFHLN